MYGVRVHDLFSVVLVRAKCYCCSRQLLVLVLLPYTMLLLFLPHTTCSTSTVTASSRGYTDSTSHATNTSLKGLKLPEGWSFGVSPMDCILHSRGSGKSNGCFIKREEANIEQLLQKACAVTTLHSVQ